ncbi:C25 family cysteine peptidase [Epilithonimonas hungarica]|uniref:Gingipain R n=1 Tax=Epilithonimonas hungarica TaxID=454006 RepID=A0A1G7V692_9FLAO|nr:C25 family cysteine peptidase [Epilithonimonas hungarica]SDG54470.1 gingipain R [Epilithonimonas hungarica]
MRKNVLFSSLILIFLSGNSFAQDFKLINSDNQNITVDFDLGHFEKTEKSINGKNYHSFSKQYSVLMSEAGNPAMPYFSRSIQLPEKGDFSYKIVYDSYEDINNIDIAPSKGNLKRNTDPETIPYVFGESYKKDDFFPGNLAQFGDPHILRNTRGVTFSLFPYQYNPVQHKLRIYKNLRVEVVLNDKKGTNEIASRKADNTFFNDIYSKHYLNHITSNKYAPAKEEGDLLIITAPAFESQLSSLVSWKREKGIKTTVVNTTTTGTTDTAIKNYITNFYQTNPNLVYILLVGDSGDVPSHTYGYNGEQLWSDSYYGQFTNDYYPEAFVGRLSGNSVGIKTMTDRILEYEKSPIAGDWMKNAIGIGSNEGNGYGNDGEADYVHLRKIRTQLKNYGYQNVYEFYQGSQGGEDTAGEPTPTMINNAMNSGVGLFNYTGHGDLNLMVTGNYTSTYVKQLKNNGMYPFVVSVACNNGTFVGKTCLAEDLMSVNYNNSPAGSIATAASTILMAWAEPMETQDEMTNILTEVYENNKKETIGGLFYNSQIGMLESYNASPTAVEVMQTWVLFGDPSVVFRYDTTKDLELQHPDQIDPNTQTLTVSCEETDAVISLTKNGNIIGSAHSKDGSVVFDLSGIADGESLMITATKQNLKPYQATIEVKTLGVASFKKNGISIYPIPAKDIVNLVWENAKPTKVLLYDLTGKLLQTINNTSDKKLEINVSKYPKGTYLLRYEVDNKAYSEKLIVE